METLGDLHSLPPPPCLQALGRRQLCLLFFLFLLPIETIMRFSSLHFSLKTLKGPLLWDLHKYFHTISKAAMLISHCCSITLHRRQGMSNLRPYAHISSARTPPLLHMPTNTPYPHPHPPKPPTIRLHSLTVHITYSCQSERCHILVFCLLFVRILSFISILFLFCN